jgi:hypothetical protein
LRTQACIALLLTLTAAAGASVRSNVATFSSFVPTGWKLVDSNTGELTGDRFDDAVILIQQNNAVKRIKNDDMGQPELDLNPRRLIVLSGTVSGYRLLAASHKLIPPAGSEETPCLVDPYQGSAIARNTLTVTLTYWLSCGSYGVTNNRFVFRVESERLRLIGFDRMEFTRSTGRGEKVSVNFLTGRKNSTPFAIDDSVREKLRWGRITPRRIHLEDLDPSACEPIDSSTNLC